jgi:hypothetical protein
MRNHGDSCSVLQMIDASIWNNVSLAMKVAIERRRRKQSTVVQAKTVPDSTGAGRYLLGSETSLLRSANLKPKLHRSL